MKLVLHLGGGLGNQMFQYATARALAARNGAELVLDQWSGFVRDRVFKRHYALSAFAVQGRAASRVEGLPFWYERYKERHAPPPATPITENWWGVYLYESEHRFYPEVASLRMTRSTWMRGHWQCEAYFAAIQEQLARELSPPDPVDGHWHRMRDLMASTNSIAVGVRLYEDLPGATKAEVGGLTDAGFYRRAAARLAAAVPEPVFFVFCSQQAEMLQSLDLPGPVHYVTGDNGFADALGGLWLLSQCRHHILANSSFFWWGAWLAERRQPATRVIASSRFASSDTVPARWTQSE
jgi:hypothetical protein